MDEWKNALKHGAGRFCNRKHDRGKRMPSACQCEGGDEQAEDENGEEAREGACLAGEGFLPGGIIRPSGLPGVGGVKLKSFSINFDILTQASFLIIPKRRFAQNVDTR
jgi:hypothetical protein